MRIFFVKLNFPYPTVTPIIASYEIAEGLNLNFDFLN